MWLNLISIPPGAASRLSHSVDLKIEIRTILIAVNELQIQYKVIFLEQNYFDIKCFVPNPGS